MSNDVKDKSRLIFEAAQELGWSDPTEIADFVRRLERGLSAEDELSVVLHWLGRCKLVHKLDQFSYPPGALEKYRVPDLLAVFDVDGVSVAPGARAPLSPSSIAACHHLGTAEPQ